MLNNTVTFKFAEVVNTYDDTYKYLDNTNSDNLFVVEVQTYGELETRTLKARPSNPNIKQIPLIGEQVIIFSALQQQSTNDIKEIQWYYLPAYSIQSAINNNAIPGLADIEGYSDTPPNLSDFSLGKTFTEKIVSPLQPYEGDILIEGRFSNSIRLGSTVKTNKTQDEVQKNYTLQPNWSGDISTDPIIILSNAHEDKPGKAFTVESFETDHSSLYLTSNQQIHTLSLSKPINKSTSISDFKLSQLIGDAERIILRAKSDAIILDSPLRITLNSADVRIGGDTAKHPLVKGDQLKEVLLELIRIIIAGVVYKPAGIKSTPAPKELNKLLNMIGDLNKINSNNHYLDK